MADRGAHVAHCAVVYVRRGKILGSFSRYREMGINVPLGTDTFPQDMIEEMRWTALACKWSDRNANHGTAREVFNAATLDGARALGRDDIGRLAPGAKADMVIVDFDRLHIGPVDDPIKTLVYAASGSDIDTVIVDGRVVVEAGGYPGVDESDLIRKAADGPPVAEGSSLLAQHPRGESAELLFPSTYPNLRGELMTTLIEGGTVVGFQNGGHVVSARGQVAYSGQRASPTSAVTTQGKVDHADRRPRQAGDPGIRQPPHGFWRAHAALPAGCCPAATFSIPVLAWGSNPRRPTAHRGCRAADWRASAEYAMATALRAGTTTFVMVPNYGRHPYRGRIGTDEELVEAVAATGLRAYLALPYMSGGAAGKADGTLEWVSRDAQGWEGLEQAVEFARAFDGVGEGRIRTFLFPYQADNCTPELVACFQGGGGWTRLPTQDPRRPVPARVPRDPEAHGHDAHPVPVRGRLSGTRGLADARHLYHAPPLAGLSAG